MNGFSIPREHGLIMIWSSSLLLGLVAGTIHLTTPIGIPIAILFSISIFLSYNSVKQLLDSHFTEVHFQPLMFLALSSIAALFWNFTVYTLIFFVVLAVIVSLWAVHSLRSGTRGNSYLEIILGSMALTLQFPIIFNLLSTLNSFQNFIIVGSIWWLFFGTSVMLILAVGCYRRKLPHHVPLVGWSIYLLTVFPVFYFGHLDILYILLLIDPTARSLYHFFFRPTLRKSRIPIKTVGWNLTASMFLFVALILIISGVSPTHLK